VIGVEDRRGQGDKRWEAGLPGSYRYSSIIIQLQGNLLTAQPMLASATKWYCRYHNGGREQNDAV